MLRQIDLKGVSENVTDYVELKAKIQELAEKTWDVPTITTWFRELSEHGIPKKTLARDDILANKQQILEHVKRRGEECEFLSHN